jgi:hypothetical protein
LRFLFVAIALLLRNVWVWFHWEVLSTPRRGRRRINLNRLRFKTLLFWLHRVAVAVLSARPGLHLLSALYSPQLSSS